jgi:hypothetical protein
MALVTKKEVLEAALRGEGPLGKADDDEPVYVLVADDQFAPALIELWADRAHQAGTPPEKIMASVEIAHAMRVHAAKKGGHKVPV